MIDGLGNMPWDLTPPPRRPPPSPLRCNERIRIYWPCCWCDVVKVWGYILSAIHSGLFDGKTVKTIGGGRGGGEAFIHLYLLMAWGVSLALGPRGSIASQTYTHLQKTALKHMCNKTHTHTYTHTHKYTLRSGFHTNLYSNTHVYMHTYIHAQQCSHNFTKKTKNNQRAMPRMAGVGDLREQWHLTYDVEGER